MGRHKGISRSLIPVPTIVRKTEADTQPLILTLQMDDASEKRFDRLREAHFPPERNHLRAHLTLFRRLPAQHDREIRLHAGRRSEDISPFTLTVTDVRFLGCGMAFGFSSPELASLRNELAGRWMRWLGRRTARDSGPRDDAEQGLSKKRERCMSDCWRPYLRSRSVARDRRHSGIWAGRGSRPGRTRSAACKRSQPL